VWCLAQPPHQRHLRTLSPGIPYLALFSWQSSQHLVCTKPGRPVVFRQTDPACVDAQPLHHRRAPSAANPQEIVTTGAALPQSWQHLLRLAALRTAPPAAPAAPAPRPPARPTALAAVLLAVARKVLGWPKRCKLAHAFRWQYSCNRLKLAQLLGQLCVFLFCLRLTASRGPQTASRTAAELGERRRVEGVG
jgi:hypothetical protein